MNLKDKLIRKLLDTGKKHRILVYPTLALVAVITAVSHAVYWGRGNGKKFVASTMIMVMLITQSIFMTSSADTGNSDGIDTASPTDVVEGVFEMEYNELTPETGEDENEIVPLDEENANPLDPASAVVNYYVVDETGNAQIVQTMNATSVSDGNVYITVPDNSTKASWQFGDSAQEIYFDFTSLYSDAHCQTPVIDSIPVNDTGIYSVFYMATRKAYPIVIIDSKGELENVTTTYTIPGIVSPGDINPSVNYPIVDGATLNPNRYGYLFNGYEYAGSAYTLDGAGTISISPSEITKEITLYSLWKAMTFDVTYDAISDADAPIIDVLGDSDVKVLPHTYDSDVIMPDISSMAGWAGNEAYYIAGWTDGTATYEAGETVNSCVLAQNEDDITANPNIKGVTLTGIWAYKDITLKADNRGSGNVSISDSGAIISGIYGDEINCVISADYKKDGEDGTQFSYSISTEDINKLGTYGLSVTTTSDGEKITSYVISGKLTDVTEGVSITLQVTDMNKPIGEQVSNHVVTLVSDKREVFIDESTIKNSNNDGKPSKSYDGTTRISVASSAQLLNLVEGDQVIAVFDAYALLQDPNAGNNKTITLTNVTLSGANSDRYVFNGYDENSSSVTIEGIAEVMQMILEVRMELAAGESDTVLFGQERPEYIVKIADPSKLSDDDEARYLGMADEASIMSFMQNYLGFTGWETSRLIYSSPGEYIIAPEFNNSGKNYAVSSNGLSMAFNVTREASVKDVNYSFSSEPINNYYPGLTISGAGNYDKVRLFGSGDGDITSGMSRSEAESLFSNTITLDDMTNGTITFQMLDTATGAITEPITLTGINVDTNPPVLVGFTVSPNISYFNEFNFGSYYHSQKDENGVLIESVTITVYYSSDDSPCDVLYYYFADEAGNAVGDKNREVKMTKNVDGNYQAQITIGTGAAGQLIVYAADTTGNPSLQSKLKLKEAIEYLKNSDDYYEWMVENTIDSAVINVSNSEGTYAVESGMSSENKVWYNELHANVYAEDIDSGLQKLDWIIMLPDGSTPTYTEIAGADLPSIVEITNYGKVTKANFNHTLSEGLVGEYYIAAILYDNAGNSAKLEQKGPYLLDTIAPDIRYDMPATGSYLSGVTFEFDVTEGEYESGVASVRLYKDSVSDEGLLKTWGVEDSYQYDIKNNGTYIIVATDKAGNESVKSQDFSGISDVIPEIPVIDVEAGDSKLGNDGWYIEDKPNIIISSENVTSDGIPVKTYYRITAGNTIIEKTLDDVLYEFKLDYEGVVLIEAWSESASGCLSDVASKEVKVDVDAPDVSITDSVTEKDGNLIINFRATDSVSGVNIDNVKVNDEVIQVEIQNDIVTGSFIANESQVYSIVVEDKAGNVADTIEYMPLGLYVDPVTDVTATGAYLNVDVYEGTYPIADCYIEYKKSTDSKYEECLSNKYKVDYGINMTHVFRNLEPETVYEYRVYASASTSNEYKVYTGSFKTSSKTSTATVYGTVSYDENLLDTMKTYPIFVNLYEANTVIAGAKIADANNMEYIFKNVPDGTYRIVATNGVLSKESKVSIVNGGISYPENYATAGGINFVLSGLSTSVVIDDGVINLSTDGLDKIYNTELYNGNVTEEDLEVVRNGGTINIVLYASYIDVKNVSNTTQSIFMDKIGEEAVLERYIELYIVKEVKDVAGNYVNNTPCNITRLAEPITVSFPLGNLSGKKIYVASLHGEGSNYDFINWDATSDIILSKNFVTIQTDKFSVYALYSINDIEKYYTVKWIDGDGNVIKVEQVKEGDAATPPRAIPKKTATAKYTYIFSGWDKDYSCIKEDTIISAWFKAKEKNKPAEPNKSDETTTEAPKDNKDDATTQQPTTKPDNTTGSQNKNNNDTKPQKTPVTYTYMGSAESPRTGDEAPIVILAVVMMLAGAGMVVVRKKKVN